MTDTVEMTEVRVTVFGGAHDGWHGRIRVPLQAEREGHIRCWNIVHRVHRKNGQMLLVDPTAQKLIWP
jgi:hypothetical protein